MTEVCENCATDIMLNFCPNCGRRKVLARIDAHYLIQEIRSVLSFDKGFFFTIRELAIKPGKAIHNFLNQDRNRLVKPIVFLILTSLIYTVFNNLFHFEDSYIKFSGNKESATVTIFEWIQGNYGFANIIMAIFIGLYTKLFFKNYNINIFEILVLLCFVMGMGMLIYSVFGIIQSYVNFNLMQIAGMVGFVYFTWAIGQFFGKGRLVNYVKALFAYILGLITFSITAVLVGLILDLLIYK